MKIKTRQLKAFLDQISELNLHFSHLLFLSEQFVLDHQTRIDDTVKEDSDALTNALFSENRFQPQFNSHLSSLLGKKGQVEKTKNFLFESLFIFACVQFEVYLKDVYQKFACELESSSTLPDLKAQKILQQIVENLDLELEDKYFLSAEYTRLRRNSLLHRGSGKIFKGELATFVKERGTWLNQTWQDDTELNFQELDFASKNIEAFGGSELIDVYNLMRRVAESIDSCITAKYAREVSSRVERDFKDTFVNQPWIDGSTPGHQAERNSKFERFARFYPFVAVSYTKQEIQFLWGVA